MIETIKSVLKEFPQANLESESCREKITEVIEQIFIDIIKALEKDNDN